MKSIFSLSVLVVMLFSSCNSSDTIYESNIKDFKDYLWKKDRVLSFDVQVEDVAQDYQLFLNFSHIYGFPYTNLNFEMEIEMPDGKKEIKKYSVPIFKDSQTYYSKCSGDYCDLEYNLEKQLRFPIQGKYVFKIKQINRQDQLPLVMGIGIRIDKIINDK